MGKKIIGIDIGGTTFSSALFNENLDLIETSNKQLISEIDSTNGLLRAFSDQINAFNGCDIAGVGVSCPGPLDSKNGIVLDTPNLELLQNVNLKKELESRCGVPVYIENDANLFALGEWHQRRRGSVDVFAGVTLGTGLGFGVVINGQIFSGGHGLAAEYAISPIDHGNWETYISISGIKKISQEHTGKPHSPRELNEMAKENDGDAILVWNEFGEHLGLALSHFINMIDPEMISIGGGISKAFNFFEPAMVSTLNKFSPSYKNFNIEIFESRHGELSSQLGAALLLKTYQKY